MSNLSEANTVRPSRRRVLSALGGSAVVSAIPASAHASKFRQRLEAYERLEREVDRACDAWCAAPIDGPTDETARNELDRLVALRDRAFKEMAAERANNREDIERKVAIFRDWTGEAYHEGDLWTVMIESVLRDFRALS